jgi:Fibrobacter succinogenes major domain (Fib_succ_major).
MGDSIPFANEVAGLKLKEAGNSHWTFNDTIHASNEYGFTALPGGERNVYGPFFGIGEEGWFWSSSEDDYNKGDGRNIQMNFDKNYVTDIEQYKQFGMSVRCVKN